MNIQEKIKAYNDRHVAQLLAKTFADWHDVAQLATMKIGKFSCYVSNGLDFTSIEDEAIWKFVLESLRDLYGDKTPKFYEYAGGIVNGGLFFFDSEYEMIEFYKIFEQPLTDSSPIYACTISPEHGSMTENT